MTGHDERTPFMVEGKFACLAVTANPKWDMDWEVREKDISFSSV